MPDKTKTIREGGILFYKNIIAKENMEWLRFKALLDYYKIDVDKPLDKMTKKEMDIICYGAREPITYSITSKNGNSCQKTEFIEGVCTLIERRYVETSSSFSREWYGSFMSESTCPTCNGRRLNEQALSVKVCGLNIYEWTQMSVIQALNFVGNMQLTPQQEKISRLIMKEIKDRLEFLNNVGLSYLTLDRLAGTLSGGEAQRIRLATQIGSKLTGVLYVLDEPSIGLHQKDNEKLIRWLYRWYKETYLKNPGLHQEKLDMLKNIGFEYKGEK